MSKTTKPLAHAAPQPTQPEAEVEAAARKLLRERDPKGAVELLQSKLRNLAIHQDARELPCLCRKCIVPSLTAVTSPVGGEFFRDFVVGLGRVLFYWAPMELIDDAVTIRRSTAGALRERVAMLARRRRTS